ncbi:MAG TPA: DUF397 domain-containing protein [Streptosporangiaceae bacterium]
MEDQDLTWRKSTRSSNGGATCVELAGAARHVAVRDSKDKAGPRIEISRSAFRRLVTDVKQGRYTL